MDLEYLIVNNGISKDIFNDPFFMNKNIRVLHSNKNLGASWGRNFGALHSSGEYLVFLDSDVLRLTPDCIHSMKKILTENVDIGCIGGQIIEHTEFDQTLHMGTFADHDFVNRKYLYNLVDDIYCNTSCIMVNRKIFGKINGFTDYIEYMHDDVDFGFKINAIGLRNVVDQRCLCFHPIMPLSMPRENLFMMIKNSMIFYFINYPLMIFLKKNQSTIFKTHKIKHPLDNNSTNETYNNNKKIKALEKIKFLFCLFQAILLFCMNIKSLIKMRNERLALLKSFNPQIHNKNI
jgi:glycosyltransferase involved in cell wall biosynthesis